MERLAIVGTGIAGMGAAHLLKDRFELQMFEQNDYVGGHSNTISVEEDGRLVHMDTGFMVFNFQTYPHLCRLFRENEVPIKKTSMSFSVQYCPEQLEYCGSGLNGLFAQRRNIFRPRFIRMHMQISRFNKISVKIMDDPQYRDHTIGEYIKEFGFGADMLWKYLVPMSSAVWSTPMDKMLDFPAQTLIRFFYNHGFLGLNTQHQWYTVEKGSQTYRDILIRPFKEQISVKKKVVQLTRDPAPRLYFEDGSSAGFDRVILACHADQALQLLEAPSPDEQRLLQCFKYEKNVATVHTDESVMPHTRSAWSSWNYRIEAQNGKWVPSTIYWMNSLQGVSEKKNYFVSINALKGSIDPKKQIREIEYEHPLFDLASIRAQDELHRLNEKGPVYFCGSYFKYGFHEDAYASAVSLAQSIREKNETAARNA